MLGKCNQISIFVIYNENRIETVFNRTVLDDSKLYWYNARKHFVSSEKKDIAHKILAKYFMYFSLLTKWKENALSNATSSIANYLNILFLELYDSTDIIRLEN